MKKRILLLVLGLFAATSMYAAENLLTFTESVTIVPGGTAVVNVALTNQEDVGGIQFDLTLPEGLSIVTKSNGKLDFTLNPARIDGHTVLSNVRESGMVSVIAYAGDASPFLGVSGQLLSFTIKASASYSGNHNIDVSNIKINTVNGVRVNTVTSAVVQVASSNILATSIALNKTSMTLVDGASETLIATVLPENASNKFVSWSTSDPGLVIVDENGLVTTCGGDTGEATITATTTDGSNLSASCVVTVVSNPATSITINKKGLTLYPDERKLLVATVLPENATNKTVIWSSDDPAIATVDQNGIVTGVSPGVTHVRAETGDGTNLQAASYIKVIPREVVITELKLDKLYDVVMEGESIVFAPIISPDDATLKTLEWKSSDENVATVDGNGHVEGKSKGVAVITASTTDGSNLTAYAIAIVDKNILKGDMDGNGYLDVTDVTLLINEVMK